MKGIILAGGKATRLYPSTISISKHLIPIYDKPMIYYPLSTLMLAGIKEILIIVNEKDLAAFRLLLQDGSQLGMSISYKIQSTPKGIAEALIIGEEFINGNHVALILGDNIFYGHAFTDLLLNVKKNKGATIFAYAVNDPSGFGIVEIDKESKKIISIDEKPSKPKSNLAITGLYFYDDKASKYAKTIKPSKRGELEITDLNSKYLEQNNINVITLSRGFSWLDTGTPNTLIEASQFVHIIEKRQGFKIGCIEEIAWRNKWIDSIQLLNLSKFFSGEYGKYLTTIIDK
jgi:glucose-1-phosphate thymidylyltransferase